MTKKELVELLDKNFADDEEVFFTYCDDMGECVEKVSGITTVTQTFCDYEYEVLNDDGEWVAYEFGKVHPTRKGYKNGEYREVNYREWKKTNKCIH